MRLEIPRGMGWIPDVPSFKDYTLETSSVQKLIGKTKLASYPGVLPGTSRPTARSAGGGSGAATALAPAAGLATHVDLRPYCSPIEDQNGYNSCTANAAVALVEYFENRSCSKFVNASRMFVWKTTHDLMGIAGNVGAYIRTTMESLVLFGSPPEQYWAYDAKHFDVEPTAFCYAFAENYKTIQYLRLDPASLAPAQVLDNVRLLLNYSFPSMFGLPVYDEFEDPNKGQIAYPAPNSRYYGSHAICAVGYDDDMLIGSNKGALLVRNSWGTSWGDTGYGWLSYKYVTQGLTSDWWTLINESWVDTGVF